MAKRVFISGKVQGVSFRYYTHEKARQLGVKGWVRNLHDGRVEMYLLGETEKINELIKWAHQGPPTAQVEKVEVKEARINDDPQVGEYFYIKREADR